MWSSTTKYLTTTTTTTTCLPYSLYTINYGLNHERCSQPHNQLQDKNCGLKKIWSWPWSPKPLAWPWPPRPMALAFNPSYCVLFWLNLKT